MKSGCRQTEITVLHPDVPPTFRKMIGSSARELQSRFACRGNNNSPFVLPAFVEHQPRRLLEAVAHGVPVIASKAVGLGTAWRSAWRERQLVLIRSNPVNLVKR